MKLETWPHENVTVGGRAVFLPDSTSGCTSSIEKSWSVTSRDVVVVGVGRVEEQRQGQLARVAADELALGNSSDSWLPVLQRFAFVTV